MFKVIVGSLINDNHGDLLRQLRLLGALSVAEANKIGEHLRGSLPCTLVAGISHDRAAEVVQTIQRLGGSARIEPTDIDQPMILFPSINVAHEMTFWGLRDVQKAAAV